MPLKRPYNIFTRFLELEAAGGMFLFGGALLAIAFANTAGLAEWREHFLHTPVVLGFGEYQLEKSFEHFVNDGLMAVFFLLVGLEIKRELLRGELSSRASALLPAIVAGGGMLVPAAIYSALNWGDSEAMRGWAIPTATDIAFSLGILSLLGKRVPLALKVFLTAIAIIDDLGAIAIIALFYTEQLSAAPLAGAGLTLAALAAMNNAGVMSRLPYLVAGFILWLFVLQSGVHATLAGVATAFMIPLTATKEARSPLEAIEHDFTSFVVFIVLPIFAFTNAGVDFSALSPAALVDPVPLGIALGLVFGKMVGVFGTTYLCVKFNIAPAPGGANWTSLFAIAMLCGVGFTVSLFIGNLAFGVVGEQINLVKLGVLVGSAIAGISGYLALRAAFPARPMHERR
jgi:NhaA family Na+:H+ antiporter